MCIPGVSSLSRVSFCVIVFCYMFMCVSCFGLVVSTYQVIGYRKTPLMTPSSGEIISTKPRWKRMFCVYFSFVWFVYVAMCSPRPYTIYISYAWPDVALCAESAVKHQTNKQTNKPTNQPCQIQYNSLSRNFVRCFSSLSFKHYSGKYGLSNFCYATCASILLVRLTTGASDL